MVCATWTCILRLACICSCCCWWGGQCVQDQSDFPTIFQQHSFRGGEAERWESACDKLAVWMVSQTAVPACVICGTFSCSAMTAGLRNILRGCLLAFLATFAGCFLFFTLPDLVASKINKQLPYWFYANEVSFLKQIGKNGILHHHVADT